jgi:hypothetical protein
MREESSLMPLSILHSVDTLAAACMWLLRAGPIDERTQTFTSAGGNGPFIKICVESICPSPKYDSNVVATAAYQVYKVTVRKLAGEGGTLYCQHNDASQPGNPLSCELRRIDVQWCESRYAH